MAISQTAKTAFFYSTLVALVAAIIGWAGWLSTKVVSLAENSSGFGVVLTKIEGRVDRISERLPTELALQTREVINRRIKSAILVGEAYEKLKKHYRVISVYDGHTGKLSVGSVEVLESGESPSIGMAVLFAKNRSDSAATIAQIETFAQKYDVDLTKMPWFIDKDISVVSDLPASEMRGILSKQTKWRETSQIPDPYPNSNFVGLVHRVSDKKDYFWPN